MDDRYTLAAARYVELNPVRAGLVARAEDYPWSSARANLLGQDDCLVRAARCLRESETGRPFSAKTPMPGSRIGFADMKALAGQPDSERMCSGEELVRSHAISWP